MLLSVRNRGGEEGVYLWRLCCVCELALGIMCMPVIPPSRQSLGLSWAGLG